MTISNNIQFIEKTRTWLNHKIILSVKSDWYKISGRNSQIFQIKNIFNSFLTSSKYSIGQLSIDIKRHEDLLMSVLPNPNNPSYDFALQTIHDLIKYAERVIMEYNLQELISK